MKKKGIKMKNKAFIIAMICLTLICISPIFIGQWLIQRQASATPTYPEYPECNCPFPKTATYNGAVQDPSTHPDVVAIYGTDFETYNADGTVKTAGIAFEPVNSVDKDVLLTFNKGIRFYNEKTGEVEILDATSADFLMANGINIPYKTAILWKWAGTYTFKIVDHVTGQVICENHTYTIKPATLTPDSLTISSTDPIFEGDSLSYTAKWYGVETSEGVYEHTLTLDQNNYIVKAGGFHSSEATSQTLSLSVPANKISYTYSGNQTYTDSFYNNYDLKNSESVGGDTTTYTVQATTSSVLDGATLYHSSVTQAIDNCKTSGTKIYPLQSIGDYIVKAGATPDGHYTHTITKNCTLASGVTLILPVTGLSENIVTVNNVVQMEAGNYLQNNKVVAYDDATKKYEINTVFIASNVTLTNDGTIILPAQVSGGGGGYPVNSMVGGNYSRIALESGAKIINNTANSVIYCFGFIDKGTTGNNNSQLQMNAGTMYTMFTISEHRGGSVYLGLANPDSDGINSGLNMGTSGDKCYYPNVKVFPFNRFYIQSVGVLLKTSSSATVYGHTSLTADGANNTTNFVLIGSTNSALIQLSSGSRVESQFTGPNTTTVTATADREAAKKMVVKIYGSATMNPIALFLSITKTMSGITATINVSLTSGNAFFPISHHLDIHLKRLTDSNGNPTGTATISLVNQDIKILPGATMIIDEGVTVNADQMVVYKDNSTLNPADSTAAQGLSYPNKPAGQLVVNGTLNVNGIGGSVTAGSLSAKLNVSSSNSVCSDELMSTTSDSLSVKAFSFYDITIAYKKSAYYPTADSTCLLSGLTTTDLATATTATLKVSPHYAMQLSNSCVWRSETQASVHYNLLLTGATIGSQFQNVNISSSGMTDNLTTLLKPTAKGYQFEGWYIDAACTTAVTQAHINNSNSLYQLYAKWVQSDVVTITINKNGSIEELEAHLESQNVTLPGIIEGQCDTVTYQQYAKTWTLTIKDTSNNVVGTYTYDGGTTPSILLKDIIGENYSYLTALDYTYSLVPEIQNKVKLTVKTTRGDQGDNSGDLGYFPKFTLQGSSSSSGTSPYTIDSQSGDKEGNYSYWIIPTHYVYLTNSDSSNAWASCSITAGSWTAVTTSGLNITIKGKKGKNASCLVEGTLITLADGTQKPIEDLKIGDMLLVFNHFTGKLETRELWINEHAETPAELQTVANLKFSNGIALRIVGSHGVFDLTENKYVFITAQNVSQYVGHEFVTFSVANGAYEQEIVRLDSYSITEEVVRVYSPTSFGTYNCVANTLLITPPSMGSNNGYNNVFDFGENLRYDEEKMAEDIEMYGLLPYDDVSKYMSFETYEQVFHAYAKIALEKGIITNEDYIAFITYLSYTHPIT